MAGLDFDGGSADYDDGELVRSLNVCWFCGALTRSTTFLIRMGGPHTGPWFVCGTCREHSVRFHQTAPGHSALHFRRSPN